MTDVEKLKEAIAAAEWLLGPVNTGIGAAMARPNSMHQGEVLGILLEAARSTLPKMKTVEGEAWGVMDKEGEIVDASIHEDVVRARASGWNATYGSARPYTVFRLTGTAEIPA